MRAWILLVALSVAGCATGAAGGGQLFAQPTRALLPDAHMFAVAAHDPRVYVTSLGSWTEPLVVSGTVVHAGALSERPFSLDAPNWLGTHELVVRSGGRSVVLQYDSPAAGAPVHEGERVRVTAHTMRTGPQLVFSMTVLGADGQLAMAGMRVSSAVEAMLPEGWSIDFGPAVRTSPMCGGELTQRSVRVRGPGGEAVVMPGWTSVAPLGSHGARYAVDVARATVAKAPCDRATTQTELSVVIRKL